MDDLEIPSSLVFRRTWIEVALHVSILSLLSKATWQLVNVSVLAFISFFFCEVQIWVNQVPFHNICGFYKSFYTVMKISKSSI
jgi:hypothetical protein